MPGIFISTTLSVVLGALENIWVWQEKIRFLGTPIQFSKEVNLTVAGLLCGFQFSQEKCVI